MTRKPPRGRLGVRIIGVAVGLLLVGGLQVDADSRDFTYTVNVTDSCEEEAPTWDPQFTDSGDAFDSGEIDLSGDTTVQSSILLYWDDGWACPGETKVSPGGTVTATVKSNDELAVDDLDCWDDPCPAGGGGPLPDRINFELDAAELAEGVYDVTFTITWTP